MRQTPAWAKVLLIASLIVAVLLPLAMSALSNPMIATFLPLPSGLKPATKISSRYSVQNDLSGYTLTLSDTQFLDYLTAKYKIFGQKAIADRRIYKGFNDIKLRYTVSKVQFVLTGDLENPIYAVMVPNVKPLSFLAKSEYDVTGDTLIVRVSLNMDKITGGVLVPKFALENQFLQMVSFALYYAEGNSYLDVNAQTMGNITMDIQSYLYSGIFPWPFRIVKN